MIRPRRHFLFFMATPFLKLGTKFKSQFDLNCATVHAHHTATLGIRNDMNPQNCHLADHIRAEVNSLDGFWRRTRYAAMKARHFSLVCCALGLVLPYSQFVPWVLEYALNVTLFCRELFGNRISAFFAMM